MNIPPRPGTLFPGTSLSCRPLVLAACIAAVASGCGTTPSAPEEAPDFDRAAAVATIRATGTASGDELDVQPLLDPQVADLRQEAASLEANGLYLAAAERVDQALAINPDDPNVLQQRAELALLLGEPDDAEQFALRARAVGTDVGPLCRKNWETVIQARAAGSRPPQHQALPRVSVDEAARRRDACTVARPPRY